MTEQTLRRTENPAVQAFLGLIRTHAAITRDLSAQLQAEHGLTINDFEALHRLAGADGRQMRRVDLARQLLLTPSGVTRLLEGLESSGLVERVDCPNDLRVSWARLTDNGLERLRSAAVAHVAAIEALLSAHLGEKEIGRLAGLLAKLPGGSDAGDACG